MSGSVAIFSTAVSSMFCRSMRIHLACNLSLAAPLSSSTAILATPTTTFPSSSDELGSDSSRVLQDRDLLRKSNRNATPGIGRTTGLYVLDLVNSGSLYPDVKLYNKLLRRCTQLQKLDEGRTVHAHLVDSSFFSNDLVIQNTVLNMYVKCGSLSDAHNLFVKMRLRDVVSWTTLISGYSQHNCPEDAFILLSQMLQNGFEPNAFTLSSVIKASGTNYSSWKGMTLHAFCLKLGYHSDIYVGSSLVDMYARCNFMKEALFIFDGMESKNDVSWNVLIAGYARKGEGELAIRYFSAMLRERLRPSHFTYSSMFVACASTGALEQGKWIHAHMVKSGEPLVAFVGNTLIDMYAKSGSIRDARHIFNRLVKWDVVSWNSMLAAFAQYGLGKDAVAWFEKMLATGVRPTDISFLCVLTACSRSGLLAKGYYYFQMMNKYEIEPGISHYVAIIDLLGRAGHLGRALRFISEMSFEPTTAVWGAVLGACRMYKNLELGTYAAERIFQLDPHDSGAHMLLYNIYASSGRWNDAAKVRTIMKSIGVKKEPACSWVEIENKVHVFVADDDAHPRRDEIHMMWRRISEKIMDIGYVPDASHVLLCVDQREREVKLQRHSEKLALAFALLSTSSGSTICIKKNIRVCGDCHTAFKLVTTVYGREIILRDTNRFHNFRDGLCSCGDYW